MTLNTNRANDRDSKIGRRDALRLGGVTLSLGALAAACGNDRTGDASPGRVGLAEAIDPLPDYEVNDAVLLRTAASLEYTTVAVHNIVKDLGLFEGSAAVLADRLIDDHTSTAAAMNLLAEDAGGASWNDTNPWYMERTIDPILAAVSASDDPARDAVTVAITLENLLGATYQSMTTEMSTGPLRVACANACTQSTRQSAALVLVAFGIANRFTPALIGVEPLTTAAGIPQQFAINAQFGSVAQAELVIGAADENGIRRTFLVSTPAANSYIYDELGEG